MKGTTKQRRWLIRNRERTEFTPREQAVYNGLVRGMSRKEIAYELGVTLNTVDFHATNVFRKRKVSKISELICNAMPLFVTV